MKILTRVKLALKRLTYITDNLKIYSPLKVQLEWQKILILGFEKSEFDIRE